MPLPALNWKRLSSVTLAANTVNAALDALYAAGTAVTYADGSARTPGTGSAWTWAIDNTNALQPGATTAAYASPPLVTALNQRIIFAGSTAAPTTMPVYSTDSRGAGVVYASVAKNAGAYSNWNTTTPFTTGQCLGFARSAVTQVTASFTTLNMWESQEAVAVQWSRVAPNVNTSICIVGAFADPGATANGESDGRLYGLTTSGNNNYCSATFWAATTDAIFYDNAVADQNRCGFFVPGAATLELYRRCINFSLQRLLSCPAGDIPLVPAYLANTANQFPVSLRQMYVTRDTLSNLTLQRGVARGYTLGANYRTTDADTCVLSV